MEGEVTFPFQHEQRANFPAASLTRHLIEALDQPAYEDKAALLSTRGKEAVTQPIRNTFTWGQRLYLHSTVQYHYKCLE